MLKIPETTLAAINDAIKRLNELKLHQELESQVEFVLVIPLDENRADMIGAGTLHGHLLAIEALQEQVVKLWGWRALKIGDSQ